MATPRHSNTTPARNTDLIDPVDKWELEEWRNRGATIPNPEVEKNNSTEKPVEQQNKPEQPSDPLDPQQYIDQTFQRKQKQQSEDGNGDQKAQGD